MPSLGLTKAQHEREPSSSGLKQPQRQNLEVSTWRFIYKLYEKYKARFELNDKLRAKATNKPGYLRQEGKWPKQSKSKDNYLPLK